MRRIQFLIVLAATLLPALASAAVPANLPYKSPEIHPDRTVTFRVKAPKASEVLLYGTWMEPDKSLALTKDADGLWSATVGPLRPNVHAYWFVLDGAVVLDQANLYVRFRTDGSSVNMVDVPGDGLEWAVRDVPHGRVEMNWARSETFGGETRQIWVYVPPGYDQNTSLRYPVLYLFHGAGELYRGWTESGKANLIFDNLLAEGKIKPMIVVMPYTGPYVAPGAATGPAPAQRPAATPPGANGGPPAPTKAADYVVKEVMPWSESQYRIAPGRSNRAIAGFSAGGLLTATIGFNHLDLFGQMGVFSAPMRGFSTRFPGVADDPKALNAKLDLLWIGVGDIDPLATPGLRQTDEELKKAGIHHIYAETVGAHEYSVWRWCLVQCAPLLFREGGTGAATGTR